MQRSSIYLYAVLFFTIVSCEDNFPVYPPVPQGVNKRPVAIAGKDTITRLSDGFYISLNADGSYNPSHPSDLFQGLSIIWKQLNGPEPVELSNIGWQDFSIGRQAYFIPSAYGAYTFELTVRNVHGEGKDTITLTVVPGSCNPNLEYVRAEFVEESVYAKTIPSDARACLADGRLILAGGDVFKPSNEIHIYDIAAKTWKTATLPIARTRVSIGANKDFAFFTGQITATDVVDIYEFATGKITTTKLSHPRSGVSITIIGNKAVFAGGLDSKENISTVMDIYDMDNGTWSTANFPDGRYGMVATGLGSKIYFSGGYTIGGEDVSNRVDVYDIFNGQWTSLRMNRGRVDHSVAVMGGSKLVFTGGYMFLGGDQYLEQSMDWLDVSTLTVKPECLFSNFFVNEPTSYAFSLASVFVGQNLYSCYNQYLTRFDVAGNKWMISKGMKDRDLSGFFSDGNRLLAMSTKKSGSGNSDNISIYEVKF